MAAKKNVVLNRPPKNGTKKKRVVNFQATDAEIARWKRAAEKEYRSFSQWARLLLNDAAAYSLAESSTKKRTR